MTSIWWCVVSGYGYSDIPTAFQTTVNRGNKITGAAWRKGTRQTFLIAIEAVLPLQSDGGDENLAKNKLQKKFLPKETLGKTLPLCLKFKVEGVDCEMFQGLGFSCEAQETGGGQRMF